MNLYERKAADRMSTGNDSDHQLWRRASGGDPDAFGELFDRYADVIYRYAVVRLHNAHAAEEIVSIVFSEAWRQRDRIALVDGSLRPWLLGVARNQSNRHHTMRLRGDNYRPDLSDLVEPDHAERSASALDSAGELGRLIQAIDRLPDGQQEVLTLSVWGELSHDQIAGQLGISVGTVKSRLSRARTRLQQICGTGSPPSTSQHEVVGLFDATTPGENHV